MNEILLVSSFFDVFIAVSRSMSWDVFLCLQRSQVSPFFKKLAYLLAFVVKVGVVTTEAPQSKKLREWNDTRDQRTRLIPQINLQIHVTIFPPTAKLLHTPI